jgi:hypothetical protein
VQLVLQLDDQKYLYVDGIIRPFDGKIKTRDDVIGYGVIYDAGKVKVLYDYKVVRVSDFSVVTQAILKEK